MHSFVRSIAGQGLFRGWHPRLFVLHVPAFALSAALLAGPAAASDGAGTAAAAQGAPHIDSTEFQGVGDPGFRPFPEDGEELTIIENRQRSTNVDITAIRNRIRHLTQELNELRLLRDIRVNKTFSGNIEDRTPEARDLLARVIGLKEMPLPDVEPQEGQVIFWNGSSWELQTPPRHIITGPKGTIID